MSNFRQDFIWCEAEKPYPKKSHSMNKQNPNPFSISKDNLKSKLSEESTDNAYIGQTKIGMKDLCVEDKQRIANLIKELAK